MLKVWQKAKPKHPSFDISIELRKKLL